MNEPEEKRLKLDGVQGVEEEEKGGGGGGGHEINISDEGVGKKDVITKCPNHIGEIVAFFCETCKGFRCPRCCCEEGHCKGHSLSTIERGKEIIVSSFSTHSKNLEGLMQTMHNDAKRLKEETEFLENQRLLTQEDINTFTAKIHDIVDAIKTNLLQSLEAQYTEGDNKIQEQIHKCNKCLTDLYTLSKSNISTNTPLTELESFEKEVARVTKECNDVSLQNSPLTTMHKTFALTLSNEARSIIPAELVRLTSQMHYSSIPAPEKVTLTKVSGTWAKINWDLPDQVNNDEEMLNKLYYEIEVKQVCSKDAENQPKSINETFKSKFCTLTNLTPDVVYTVRVRCKQGTGNNATVSRWSTPIEMRTRTVVHYSGYWKGGPGYRVSGKNSTVVMKESGTEKWVVTAVGAEILQPDVINKWTIVLEDSELDHFGMAVGVAPLSINQTRPHNHKSCGWYYTGWSTLYSGPPSNYNNESFGEKMNIGEGTEIGLEMDMKEGTLSYYIDGKWIGVAYNNIPTKTPLVPAVVFGSTYYSIKLK